jgi:hypothetical protein
VGANAQTRVELERNHAIFRFTFVSEAQVGQQSLEYVLRAEYVARGAPTEFNSMTVRRSKSEIRVKRGDTPNGVRTRSHPLRNLGYRLGRQVAKLILRC